MSSEEVVQLEVTTAGVALVSLNRPEQLNIYNLAMRDALIEAFTAVAQHPDVRAMVLRANGTHFSAGADLREFGSARSILDARRIRWQRDPWLPLLDMPQPTIVSLHGYALGAGLEMACLCDIRLAAPDTVVGLPETRLGMLPSAGGTQSLPRAIRAPRALEITLTARNIEAPEALALGLVQRIATDVDAAAVEMATCIAALPPAAVRAAVAALRAAPDLTLRDGLAQERRLARMAAAQRSLDPILKQDYRSSNERDSGGDVACRR